MTINNTLTMTTIVSIQQRQYKYESDDDVENVLSLLLGWLYHPSHHPLHHRFLWVNDQYQRTTTTTPSCGISDTAVDDTHPIYLYILIICIYIYIYGCAFFLICCVYVCVCKVKVKTCCVCVYGGGTHLIHPQQHISW